MTTTQRESTLFKELKRIRDLIEKESVSYGDLAFIQNYQTEIKELFPDDLVFWEWAGIEE